MHSCNYPASLEWGYGAWVGDHLDRRYLDFVCGLAAVALGHALPLPAGAPPGMAQALSALPHVHKVEVFVKDAAEGREQQRQLSKSRAA